MIGGSSAVLICESWLTAVSTLSCTQNISINNVCRGPPFLYARPCWRPKKMPPFMYPKVEAPRLFYARLRVWLTNFHLPTVPKIFSNHSGQVSTFHVPHMFCNHGGVHGKWKLCGLSSARHGLQVKAASATPKLSQSAWGTCAMLALAGAPKKFPPFMYPKCYTTRMGHMKSGNSAALLCSCSRMAHKLKQPIRQS